MPLVAKNIIVGGETKPPTETEIKVTEETKEPSKYIEKKDGDLIRFINSKSHYLRDMYEVDFENNKY